MTADLETIYRSVFERCEAEGFAGYDPFDGLESPIFQATPLRKLASARLAWIQMIKRSPLNLRPLLRVPKGVNAKGLALFALAELSRYRTEKDPKNSDNARKLLEQLRSISIRGKAEGGKPTTAFGYNFDWQSRVFFAPKGTPTIVPTAFAGRAFVESFQLFGDERDLEAAREICDFIIGDLNRPHETDDEICFSYTPGDSSLIYNASLLAGETLAAVGTIDGNDEYKRLAVKTARYVIRNQAANGSWAYGPKVLHAWVDNFHTAFILSSLRRIDSGEAEDAITRGFDYWMRNFFLEDGTPKYFDSQTYPIDIHSAAAAIVTLADLADVDARALPLAEKVAEWTIENLYSESGFFYYQKRRFGTVRIPFVRWGQAWMLYGLARLMEVRSKA